MSDEQRARTLVVLVGGDDLNVALERELVDATVEQFADVRLSERAAVVAGLVALRREVAGLPGNHEEVSWLLYRLDAALTDLIARGARGDHAADAGGRAGS